MGNASITQKGPIMISTTISKLTSKYQATIPEPVRRLLHLGAGDTIAFDIEDSNVHIRKARSVDTLFAQSLQGTLTEWGSTEDEEAYREL